MEYNGECCSCSMACDVKRSRSIGHQSQSVTPSQSLDLQPLLHNGQPRLEFWHCHRQREDSAGRTETSLILGEVRRGGWGLYPNQPNLVALASNSHSTHIRELQDIDGERLFEYVAAYLKCRLACKTILPLHAKELPRTCSLQGIKHCRDGGSTAS